MWNQVRRLGSSDAAWLIPRDNKFVYMPRGVAQQGQLAAVIDKVERMLGPDVVRLRYTIGANWSELN